MAYTYTSAPLQLHTWITPQKCQSEQPIIYYFFCGVIILPNRILGTSSLPLTFCIRVSVWLELDWPRRNGLPWGSSHISRSTPGPQTCSLWKVSEEPLTCFYRLLGTLTIGGVKKSVPQFKLNATKSGCRSFTIKELLIRGLFSEVAYSTSAEKESLKCGCFIIPSGFIRHCAWHFGKFIIVFIPKTRRITLL